MEHAPAQTSELDTRDRAFVLNLVQGVLRWKLRLDWMIRSSLRFPFRKVEPSILNILRIALYQIFFMDRIPESAAVDEAVKQAKIRGPHHVVRFVNGILRQICRQKEQIPFPDRTKTPETYLSIFYSYPEWLINKWIQELGFDFTERLLSAGNRIPELIVRTNRLKLNRSRLIHRLEAEEGLSCEPTVHAPDGIKLEKRHGPIDRLHAFRQGLFQVQGEAAQICSYLVSPKPGERILDLCAGLGGKSTHLAELMEDKGCILALDRDHGRLVSLTQTLIRLGIHSVFPVQADASDKLSRLLRGGFDRILVDAPCSALGTLSRHPDGKWRRGPEDIARLSGLQKRLLEEAWPFLQPGGQMLYATCTISKDENEEVVDAFLKRNKGAVLKDLKEQIPEWGKHLIDDYGFYRMFPHIHGTEGFFAAMISKEG